MLLPPDYGNVHSTYSHSDMHGFFDFLKPDKEKQAARQSKRKKRRDEREDVFTQKQKGKLASQGLGIFGDIVKGKILGQGFDSSGSDFPAPAPEPDNTGLIIGGILVVGLGLTGYLLLSGKGK